MKAESKFGTASLIEFAGQWLMEHKAFHALSGITARLPEGMAVMQRPTVDFMGVEIPQPKTVGNVAIIPIAGALANKVHPFAKLFRVIDHQDIKADIQSAANNPQVDKIMFLVDSPGGTVSGTEELADLIADVSDTMPTVAFSDRVTASAAEWLSAGASLTLSTPSSLRGSIGVIADYTNYAKYWEQIGVEIDYITSDEFKGMESSDTALTPEQRALAQSRVLKEAQKFKDHMTRFRDIEPEAMRGQTLTGTEAHEAGIVDELVPDEAAAMARIADLGV